MYSVHVLYITTTLRVLGATYIFFLICTGKSAIYLSNNYDDVSVWVWVQYRIQNIKWLSLVPPANTTAGVQVYYYDGWASTKKAVHLQQKSSCCKYYTINRGKTSCKWTSL